MKFLKDIAAKLDRYTVAKGVLILGAAAAATFTGVASSALASVGVNAGLFAAFGVSAVAIGAVAYTATKVPSMLSTFKSFFSSKKEEKPVRRSERLAAKAKAEKQEATDKPAVKVDTQNTAKKTAEKPATRKSARLNKEDSEKSVSAEEVADKAITKKAAKVVRFDTQRVTRNNKKAAAPAPARSGMKLRNGKIK